MLDPERPCELFAKPAASPSDGSHGAPGSSGRSAVPAGSTGSPSPSGAPGADAGEPSPSVDDLRQRDLFGQRAPEDSDALAPRDRHERHNICVRCWVAPASHSPAFQEPPRMNHCGPCCRDVDQEHTQ